MHVERSRRRAVPAWLAAMFAAAVVAVAVVGVASAQQGGTGNPSLDAYVQVPPTVVVPPAPTPTPPAAEVAPEVVTPPVTPPEADVGGETESSPPAPAERVVRAKPVERGTLPFTGLQLGFMAMGALALVGLGLTLRRISRPLAA